MNQEVTCRGKILVVDDDEIFRYSVVLLLRMERWNVLEAADGEEAVKQVKAHRPDVLVLDHRMPGLSGTEVYQLLQREGIEIPTILVTAASQAENLARSVGIPYYLCKPIDFDQLQTLLDTIA